MIIFKPVKEWPLAHKPHIKGEVQPIRCFSCGKPGHKMIDCQQNPDKAPINTKDAEKTKRDLKDIKCFNCQQKGHLAARCSHGAMFDE